MATGSQAKSSSDELYEEFVLAVRMISSDD